MALAYDTTRVTRDVDSLFVPHGVVLEEARNVAKELGLPTWWLNEQASVYISGKDDPDKRRVFDHPGLRVTAASPRHIFAMKALAARTRDIDDLRLLGEMIGVESAENGPPDTRRVLPGRGYPAQVRRRSPGTLRLTAEHYLADRRERTAPALACSGVDADIPRRSPYAGRLSTPTHRTMPRGADPRGTRDSAAAGVASRCSARGRSKRHDRETWARLLSRLSIARPELAHDRCFTVNATCWPGFSSVLVGEFAH